MPDTPSDKPKRRLRYSGTHPRKFDEKYKELNPARYGADVSRIMASGKTPAGMHRPIMVKEILEVLAPKAGDIAVDATLGYGGHAAELLRAISPGGRLLALDVDPIEISKTEERLRSSDFPPEALLVRKGNFAGLARYLAAEGMHLADVVLADLGLSSMQIDNPERGFTFKRTGPLDLRMNPQRGQPASTLLASLDERRLAQLLEENADEPHAALLAKYLVCEQARQPITTTTALAAAVTQALDALPGSISKEQCDISIRRVFQALRIAVNDEFSALETFLRNLPLCLKTGGRVAILTFHSGEDRRVKKAFQEGFRNGHYARIAEEVIRPRQEETRANPRSSSAKLRWAVRS